MQGGNTPQLVIDGAGRFYFSSGNLVTTGTNGGRYLVRFNRQTRVHDTLAIMPQPIAGIALSNLDTTLYFTASDTIWKIALPSGRAVRVFSGFQYPTLLQLQKRTGRIYAIETGGDNQRASAIAYYDPATGMRTKAAGGSQTPGNGNGYVNDTANDVRFNFPRRQDPIRDACALVLNDTEDTLYIGDTYNRCIRKLAIASAIVTNHTGSLPDSIRSGYRDG